MHSNYLVILGIVVLGACPTLLGSSTVAIARDSSGVLDSCISLLDSHQKQSEQMQKRYAAIDGNMIASCKLHRSEGLALMVRLTNEKISATQCMQFPSFAETIPKQKAVLARFRVGVEKECRLAASQSGGSAPND